MNDIMFIVLGILWVLWCVGRFCLIRARHRLTMKVLTDKAKARGEL